MSENLANVHFVICLGTLSCSAKPIIWRRCDLRKVVIGLWIISCSLFAPFVPFPLIHSVYSSTSSNEVRHFWPLWFFGSKPVWAKSLVVVICLFLVLCWWVVLRFLLMRLCVGPLVPCPSLTHSVDEIIPKFLLYLCYNGVGVVIIS